MASRFQHLSMVSSDDEAAPVPESGSSPVSGAQNQDGCARSSASPVDELDTTQERIVPSDIGSPLAERGEGAVEVPPSSAFVDCVSAGATYSHFTPQRSHTADALQADVLGSSRATSSGRPILTVTETNRVASGAEGRPSLLSPSTDGFSPQAAQPEIAATESPEPLPTSTRPPVIAVNGYGADAEPQRSTPEERTFTGDEAEHVAQLSDAAVALEEALPSGDAEATSNIDSSTITSGKGVLRSLYLDQQRRQQRQQLRIAQQAGHASAERMGDDVSPGSSSDSNAAQSRPSQHSTTSTTPSNRQRRAGSAEWADSQQRTLEQLRMELEHSSQTPSRHGGGRLTPRSTAAPAAPQVPPIGAAVHAMPLSSVTPIPTPTPPKEHTVMTFRPNLSAISQISPLRNEVPSILADLYGQSPYSQPPGEVADLSPFQEDDRDDAARAYRQQQLAAQPSSGLPPHFSSALHGEPSTMSGQEDNEEESVLKWMPKEGKTYTTPSRGESPARSAGVTPASGRRRSPLGQHSEASERAVGARTATGYSARSKPSQAERSTVNTTSASGHHIPSVNVEARERKLRKLKAEVEAKEMADCTFHPLISPGTRAMVELSRAGEGMETEEAVADANASAALSEPVFERLYPEKLVLATSQKRQMEAEMEARVLAREELLSLRRRCRAPFKVETPEASFDVFLSNVLGQDCYNAGALVSTTYRSPMAVALMEEKAARRRLAERRRTELRDDVEDSQEFRIALFDEFLLRQNAHYFNRARTVQELERHLTPSFTPQTTDTSAALVKRLVERSMLDETIDPEEKAQLKKRQARGEPIASTLVRKHKSKYEDPCTFHPTISPYAAGASAKHITAATTPGSPSSPRSKQANSSFASARKKGETPRFETLYQEHRRLLTNRQQQHEKAAAEELKACTFQPTNLNSKRNAKATSFLDESSYSRLEAQKRERAKKQAAIRAEQTLLEEERESRECTFRPRVTKPPAYISRMAKSFGVVRAQDTEF